MRAQTRCLQCFIDDIGDAAQLLIGDEGRRREFMQRVRDYLAAEFDTARIPSHFITHLHRLLKRETGIEVPFADRRRRANEAGMNLAREIARRSQDLEPEERLAFLIRWATAANALDFRTAGAGYRFDISELAARLESTFAETPAADDTERVLDVLQAATSVLYILDNVGEIALDLLLIEELGRRGTRVTAGVRGGPITSDVTIEDARAVGLQNLADELILTGPDTLGISLEEMSDELIQALENHDITLSKGQANYYAFSESRPDLPAGRTVCLFTTKCEVVGEQFGVRDKSSIIKLL